MPKSCKPPPTIYFAASSRSREGVSTGPHRHRTAEAHSGPATSLPAAGGPELPQRSRSPRTVVGCVRAKRFGRPTIGSAGLYGSAALHLRA